MSLYQVTSVEAWNDADDNSKYYTSGSFLASNFKISYSQLFQGVFWGSHVAHE